MKKIKTIGLLLLMLSTIPAMSQQKLKKLSKKINADKDVVIHLNTSHVNVEVDTWNKGEIEIEAYVEGEKVSKEALEEALKNWDMTVIGSGDQVTIATQGGSRVWATDFDNTSDAALRNFEWEMAELPEMPELPELPELPEFSKLPEMPKMPKLPELPKLPEGISTVRFDFEAYKKDGEAYLEQWSKTFEEDYGKVYKEKMKEWGRAFGKTDFSEYSKNMEKWGEDYSKNFGGDYGKKMEAWGKAFEEKFGKDFGQKWAEWGERFGEDFGKRMEEQAKRVQEQAKNMQVRAEEHQNIQQERQKQLADRHEALAKRRATLVKSIESKGNTTIKRTLKIKMPKKAKLKLNVRHGELTLSAVVTDLKADIAHSALKANSIDGPLTSINVSYSPVLIDQWNLGELILNYVDKAHIENTNRMVLNANSSNVSLDTITGNAMIEGSFGVLEIHHIADTFDQLNISLENSEALLVLPKTDYNLQYKGSRSQLRHPKNKTATAPAFSTGNLASGKRIVVDAKFSKVTMQ